jgi:hypothetical protein
MSRKNGGIIGPANTPVGGLMAGVAGGVWRMNDLLDFVGNSQWPSAPQDIENSTRFNSGSSDSLTRTPSSAGNRKTWTWSGWVKRSILSSGDQAMFNAHTDSQNHVDIYFDSNDDLYVTVRISNTAANLITDAKFRDVSAWYHVVVAVDTTQSTNSDRMKLYVNGSQITSFSEAGYPSQDADTAMNNTVEHRVGDSNIETFFNGYMAEVVLIDGQQLDPTSFGEFDSTTGIWKPKKIGQQFAAGGGAGTNGFYLDFKDSSNLGNDSSGNNNDFTVNNLTSIDQTTDTCVENYVTLNTEATTTTQGTVSQGNLEFDRAGSSDGWVSILSTIAASSGKYYAEVKIIDVGSPSQGCVLGFLNWDKTNIMSSSSTYLGAATADAGMGWYSVGNVFRQGGHVNIINSYTDNDIVMLAMDLDNGYCYFGKNGSWENSGDPTSGSTGTGGYATSNMTAGGTYCFAASCREAGNVQFNFGNPPFSISSGNADANGFGNFEYSVPSGYYALNTSNLNTYG